MMTPSIGIFAREMLSRPRMRSEDGRKGACQRRRGKALSWATKASRFPDAERKTLS